MDAGDELWAMLQVENDPELRGTIVQALFVAGESGRVIELARSDPDPKVRAAAITYLGMMGDARSDELVAIYESESDREVREAVLQALMLQNNAAALIRIAREENDSELRLRAVQMLSVMGSKESTEFMRELLEE
jgi:HEAT repeat protein